MKIISTHTPREGRDTLRARNLAAMKNFNSHAPRGARRTCDIPVKVHTAFQLTRPARGATVGVPMERKDRKNFNSHAPRGARRFCAEIKSNILKFQLTRPARGATVRAFYFLFSFDISTHTPREGRDT